MVYTTMRDMLFYYIAIGVLSSLLVAVTYAVVNLYRKVGRYEDWVREFYTRIEFVDKEIHKIDRSGAFEADDEVGFIYKAIRDTLTMLTDLDFNSDTVSSNMEELSKRNAAALQSQFNNRFEVPLTDPNVTNEETK